jgi:hypothetical protein
MNYVDRIKPADSFQDWKTKIVPRANPDDVRGGQKKAAVRHRVRGAAFPPSENIKRSFDGELYFYSKVFVFELLKDRPVRSRIWQGQR